MPPLAQVLLIDPPWQGARISGKKRNLWSQLPLPTAALKTSTGKMTVITLHLFHCHMLGLVPPLEQKTNTSKENNNNYKMNNNKKKSKQAYVVADVPGPGSELRSISRYITTQRQRCQIEPE